MAHRNSTDIVTATTELRKFPILYRDELIKQLDLEDSWKYVMCRIKRESDQQPKYTTQDIQLLEKESQLQRRSPSDIFLDEWGTSGRRRPTVETLKQLLSEADLHHITRFIDINILKEPDSCLPDEGEFSLTAVLNDQGGTRNVLHGANTLDDVQLQEALARLCVAPQETLQHFRIGDEESEELQIQIDLDTNLPHFPYNALRVVTDNFFDMEVRQGGRLIGSGAFATVYLGEFRSQEQVAVKRLCKRDDLTLRQFKNEVEILSSYEHKNLLSLFGYSMDGPEFCLVYEFMCNGSLQDQLACRDDNAPLPSDLRCNIARGTAEGLVYLHTAKDKPLVHRDIKSANILLDINMEPKVGDFGLAKIGGSGEHSRSYILTNTVLGTSAYMAPEAFRGDVSVKMDTFSFGVVLMELLTGLASYDKTRKGHDLVTHLEEQCEGLTRMELLDPAAGTWDPGCAERMFDLAFDCVLEKRRRPTMEHVLHELVIITSLPTDNHELFV